MATDSLRFHNLDYLDACLISPPKYGLLQVNIQPGLLNLWIICCCQPIFCVRLFSVLLPSHLSLGKSRLSRALLPTICTAKYCCQPICQKRVGNSKHSANSTVQVVDGSIYKETLTK